MTIQVILDSRFRGNDNCSVPSALRRMTARVLLLLSAIVIASWATALADSTDQSSAPGGEAVQQAESTPISTSDSVMVDVYKALLEDQRAYSSTFAGWFSVGVLLLLVVNISVVFYIVRANERRYKMLLAEAVQRLEQSLNMRINSLVQDNDYFVIAVYNTLRAEVLATLYARAPEGRKLERSEPELMVLAFAECSTAINSLVRIAGNTQSLRNLYLWNLMGIQKCLLSIPARNMSQEHVNTLKRDLGRMRAMDVWSKDDALLNQIDNAEKLLNEVNRPSPFDDPKQESDS